MSKSSFFLGAALAAGMLASPAFALEVSSSVETSATPDQVWAVIGGFCAIEDWHPVVAECAEGEKDGQTIRTLTTVDGAVLVEALQAMEASSYSYTILESPLPVANYASTLSVSANGDGSKIEWKGNFDANGASDDEATAAIAGIYQSGLEALKAELEK